MSEEGRSETPLWADDKSWDDAQQYWRDEIDRLSVALGQAGEWPSWEETTFADGVTPIPREFRSVCEGRSDRLDRAFQILQHTAGEEGPSIAAWVKDYEHDEFWNEDAYEDESPRLPKAMLVISLTFSEETAECARTLLRKWMSQETTATDMATFIDSTCARG